MAVKEKENVEKGVRVLIKKRGFTFHKKDVIKGGKAQQVDPNIIEVGEGEKVTLTAAAAEKLFKITIKANKYNEVENLDEVDKE